jgi:hypothetical protein
MPQQFAYPSQGKYAKSKSQKFSTGVARGRGFVRIRWFGQSVESFSDAWQSRTDRCTGILRNFIAEGGK